MNTTSTSRHLPCVQLAAQSPGVDVAAWHWEHVATAGTYHGYVRDGSISSFTLSRQTFERMITNLHAHPAYKAGENGEPGKADVISWDFGHASERSATEGSIPFSGAPAAGWTGELAIRDGADGNAQLWAYTRWIEPAASYVRDGRYRWASISCCWDAVDPVSGSVVGDTITSIALTNQPFIEGMTALAASRCYAYGKADTAEEAMRQLADLFNVGALDGISAVMSQVDKLDALVRAGTAPAGVDLADILGALRSILGLETLLPAGEVVAKARSLLQAYINEQAINEGLPAAGAIPPTASTIPASVSMHNTQKGASDMELLKTIAEVLRVRENDEVVIAATRDAAALRTGTQKALRLEREVTAEIVQAAEKAVADGDGLRAILAALGVTDVKSAAGRVSALTKAEADLAAMKPQLDKFVSDEAARETERQAADVTTAIQAHKLPDSATAALALLRKSDPAEFARSFPTQKSADTKNLTQSVTTTPIPPTTPPGAIDCGIYDGPNPVARAMQHINATRKELTTTEQVFLAAMDLRKRPDYFDSRVTQN